MNINIVSIERITLDILIPNVVVAVVVVVGTAVVVVVGAAVVVVGSAENCNK